MMHMQSVPEQLPDFPSAIVLARLTDVLVNNNVLYRMVQPTEQGTEVVSVNRMVNVVPFRRVYCFDCKEELTEFCNELLKRPLVLQPVLHFGRGLGTGSLTCGMCYKDDKWVMLINQTHPKILGRLQIGLDAAKNAMARGQSCEIRFAFSKMVEKLYKETLTRSEQENAAETLDLIKSYFRYEEWEYGDLIIRYHGYAARFGRGGGLTDLSTLELSFMFEDLMDQEISWKTLGAEFFPKPHLAPVTEDEIRDCLPAWTVNGVSPLENIGEQVPAANYSYSQAGRLYESFRKKRRRPQAEKGDQAEGGIPAIRPSVTDGIELKVIGHEDKHQWQQQSPRGGQYNEDSPDQHYQYREAPHDDQRYQYSQGPHDNRADYDPRGYQNATPQWQAEHTQDDGFHEEKGAKPKRGLQYDTHGHMYPEVRVNSDKAYKSGYDDHHSRPMPSPRPYRNAPPATDPYANVPQGQTPSPYANASQKYQESNPYARPSAGQDDHEYSPLRNEFMQLHMQGSDRSSHSEAGSGVADSGICSDSDGHVREGSYDRPSVHKNGPKRPYAMDNYGFHGDDDSDIGEALRRHKEMVAKRMGGAQPQPAGTDQTRQKSDYEHQHQQRFRSPSSDRDVGDRMSKGNHVPSYAKNGVPSLTSPKGQYFDQTDGRNAHISYSPSAQSPRVPVEESFI